MAIQIPPMQSVTAPNPDLNPKGKSAGPLSDVPAATTAASGSVPVTREWANAHPNSKGVPAGASKAPLATSKNIELSQIQAKFIAAGFRSQPSERALAEHLVAAIVTGDQSLPPLQEAIQEWLPLAGDRAKFEEALRIALAEKQVNIQQRTTAALAVPEDVSPPRKRASSKPTGWGQLETDPPSALPELNAQKAELLARQAALPAVKQADDTLHEIAKAEFPQLTWTDDVAANTAAFVDAVQQGGEDKYNAIKDKLDSYIEHRSALQNNPEYIQLSKQIYGLAKRIERSTRKITLDSDRQEISSPQFLTELAKAQFANERVMAQIVRVKERLTRENPSLSQNAICDALARA